jgi:hypothetical protein
MRCLDDDDVVRDATIEQMLQTGFQWVRLERSEDISVDQPSWIQLVREWVKVSSQCKSVESDNSEYQCVIGVELREWQAVVCNGSV